MHMDMHTYISVHTNTHMYDTLLLSPSLFPSPSHPLPPPSLPASYLSAVAPYGMLSGIIWLCSVSYPVFLNS